MDFDKYKEQESYNQVGWAQLGSELLPRAAVTTRARLDTFYAREELLLGLLYSVLSHPNIFQKYLSSVITSFLSACPFVSYSINIMFGGIYPQCYVLITSFF